MAVSQDELERDIQSAEHDFLAEVMTDDEVDDAGAIDEDNTKFDEQLKLVGEITCVQEVLPAMMKLKTSWPMAVDARNSLMAPALKDYLPRMCLTSVWL